MEVDRIWRIEGMDGNANPAWQNSARRRRRFVEEVPPIEEEGDAAESDAGQEAAPQDDPSVQNPGRISIAEDSTPDPSGNAEDRGKSFHAIA